MKLFLASSLQTTGSEITRALFADGNNGKLMFMTTASEPEKGDLSWLAADKQPLVYAGLDVFNYSVTNKTEKEIEKALEGVGAVCVAGGNTYYLLHHARKSGFDKVVTRLVMKGMPYIGSSAGALLAGPTIKTSLDDPRIVPELTDYTGLNLCNISIRPHWGSAHFASRYRDEFDRLYNLQEPMILLTDQEYAIVDDNQFTIVSV
ncbi:Type 1 glutamine amidotransferase-like domain-containing protein [Candidatus Woesebacteria bacterium]|nr:Type 1 glutamine amidotransferase-like domain-containing protein [Candidatus Woesebacteria bacterium]